MLFLVEQAFVGKDERQALLKMLAWEATEITEQQGILIYFIFNMIERDRTKWLARRKVDQSTPQMQSVWTLFVDWWLLYRALLNFKESLSLVSRKMLKRWCDNVNSMFKQNCQMFNKRQAKSSFASIPTWLGQYKSYYVVEKSKCHKISVR